MTAQLIDGKAIAEAVRREAAVESARLKSLTGQAPTLAAVLVGEDPASQTYVGAKGKACEEAGMGSITHRLPATATQAEVEESGAGARTPTRPSAASSCNCRCRKG